MSAGWCAGPIVGLGGSCGGVGFWSCGVAAGIAGGAEAWCWVIEGAGWVSFIFDDEIGDRLDKKAEM